MFDTIYRLWHVFNDRFRLPIKHSDVVLDVGCGTNPHPRANVLCDKYIEEPVQRLSGKVRDTRPIVRADITRLPFRSASFDFVICSHLLEHVNDLERALAELERVARAGFIMCPSPLWEKLCGRRYHLWLCEYRDTQLLFRPKQEHPLYPELGVSAYKLRADTLKGWPSLFLRNHDALLTELCWTGTIPYVIEGSGQPDNVMKQAISMSHMVEDGHRILFRKTLHKVVQRLLWGKPRSVSMQDLLQCPACGGEVTVEQARNSVQCNECGRVCSLHGNVYDMMQAFPNEERTAA